MSSFLSMKGTPSARTRHRSEKNFFHFLPPYQQHPVHLPESLHIPPRSRAVLSYSSSRQQGHTPIENAPTRINFLIMYISPGSSLGKSMTGKLVYNFFVMSMNFTSSSLRVPNNNDNYTVTLTRITVHRRCSILAMWRGRTTEIRVPRCA